MEMYYGICEDRINDPLRLGRLKVRIVGVHTPDKTKLPTVDLPWAWPIQDITSAALSGIGIGATGVVEGSTVVLYFADDSMQIPMIVGTLAGIPSANEFTDVESVGPIQAEVAITPPTAPPPNVVKLQDGTTKSPEQVVAGDKIAGIVEQPYVGTMTKSHVEKLKAVIAEHESGTKGYSAENSLGFLGKYQFGALYLEDMGYLKPGAYARVKNNLKVVSDPTNWTGKSGVTTKEAFKTNPAVQEELILLMLKRNFKSLCKSDALTPQSPPEKISGALMAAHLKGAGGARDYIKRGINGEDAYGTSCEKYYKIGYAAIAGKGTYEAPTAENIGKQAVDINEDSSKLKSVYDIAPTPTGINSMGFSDPNGRYPLSNHAGEPDTPRVASAQKISQTIVGEKEADRTMNVPIANGASNWSQPAVPFNAKYPYNHAHVTESGHVLEFDDTKGSERVNIHHMSGTFTEVDAFGNQVNKVKRIRTVIVEEDDLLNIQGSGHVSIVGDLSVRVGEQCQVEIMGNANVRVHGNLTAAINGSASVKVDGSMTQEVIGAYNIKAASFNVHTAGVSQFNSSSFLTQASGAISFKAGGDFNADGANVWLNSGKSSAVPVVSPLAPFPQYKVNVNVPEPINRASEMSIALENEHDEPNAIAAQLNTEASSSTPQAPVSDLGAPVAPAQARDAVIAGCDFGSLSYETQLTKNFKLSNIKGSQTFPFGGQHGLSANEIACNLKQLCVNILEPLRERYAAYGMVITNTYRSAGSATSKSSKVSQHELGMAADIAFTKIPKELSKKEFHYKIIKEIENTLPYDQLLFEYKTSGSVWIHISHNPKGGRKQHLTLENDGRSRGGKTAVGLVFNA